MQCEIVNKNFRKKFIRTDVFRKQVFRFVENEPCSVSQGVVPKLIQRKVKVTAGNLNNDLL
jgi:hypothetical protein